MIEDDEMVTTERVALVVWQIANGNSLSTADVAKMLCITHSGAWRLLAKLCRVLPVSMTDGVWHKMQN